MGFRVIIWEWIRVMPQSGNVIDLRFEIISTSEEWWDVKAFLWTLLIHELLPAESIFTEVETIIRRYVIYYTVVCEDTYLLFAQRYDMLKIIVQNRLNSSKLQPVDALLSYTRMRNVTLRSKSMKTYVPINDACFPLHLNKLRRNVLSFRN